MKTRPIGSSGIQASPIVFGAWAIGGTLWGGTDEAAAVDAIRAAIEHGINCIDTAPVYGFGLSETLVGKAVEGKRDQVVIATKCGLRWDIDHGEYQIMMDDKPIHRFLGPDSIRHEVEQSLKRLNTDYIDLLQTHWQEDITPVEDVMETLVQLKQEGKIRAIGVSNCSAERMQRYAAVGPIDSDQEKYSMLDRDIEKDQLPYCKANNISVLAYSPLSMGILTGKLTPERQLSGDDIRQTRPRFSKENRARVIAMLDEMKPVADKYELTSAQLVLAWTIAQPGLTHALAGARNPQQAIENAKAGSVELTADDLDEINRILETNRPNIV